MVQQEAVVVRNAIKCYEKEKTVLNGVNMTVSRGSIYGLLGASGCGKTTLLSCMVGVRHLNSGELWVLGGKPGSKGSGVPGPRVGYMPQDISLIGEFSRSGALYYFGRINGLDDDEISARQTFFAKLLQLPPEDRLVNNMSGGQQRRVSFAAALIHKPELLILDEPTVGLDPILRENIWAYLLKITQEEGITVIITTHYIEETKDANKIGLLRNGKLLAESTPQKLLDRFQCELLEEAFLKLSEAQENNIDLNETQESKEDNDVLNQDQDRYKQIKEFEASSNREVPSSKRLKALMAKNSAQFLRYYTGLVLALFFPFIQLGAFFIGVGKDPKDLKLAIINEEAGNCAYGIYGVGNVWSDETTCHFGNLSCRFLDHFHTFEQEFYDDFSDASDDVKKGEIRGIIYFSQNFSESLQARIEEGSFATDSDLLASEIQVFLDMGDRQVGLYMQQKLFELFVETYENIMRDCKYPIKLADLPIRFEEPIYGALDLTYSDYMIPPFLLTLIFFLAITISTSLIISERLAGVWDRSVVQGVKAKEIVLSHVIIQTGIISIQALTIIVVVFPIYGWECKGSIVVSTIFVFFAGFCGLMYGFVISVFCSTHALANNISTGSFFPLLILNGCVWPLEGMPKVLRWISYTTPTAYPSKSLRALIYKGYSISDSEVYIGILVNIGWIIITFALVVFGVKKKASL